MEREKYVDESWKESAQKEKEKLKTAGGGRDQSQRTPTPEPSPAGEEPQAPTSDKDRVGPEETGDTQESPLSFLNYISSLAYQAMIFLGEIPNPMTNMPEVNVEQAKFVIDTLTMLREKTKGNLSKKESDVLNASLYQLQMKFVEVYQREGSA